MVKLFVPVNCCRAWACSCCLASIHFQPPNCRPRVKISPQVHNPPSIPHRPSAEDQACSEENLHPCELPWLSMLSSVAPFTFGHLQYSQPSFELVSMCMYQAGAVCDEEVCFPGELVRAQHAVISSQILSLQSMSMSGLSHVPCLPCHALHVGGQNEIMPSSGLLT
jgi:hypothetical protein